jgi:hypothetical protein
MRFIEQEQIGPTDEEQPGADAITKSHCNKRPSTPNAAT